MAALPDPIDIEELVLDRERICESHARAVFLLEECLAPATEISICEEYVLKCA